MIPVYFMEEHNEAFYYWGLAMEMGYIKKKGNVLFHIDHHDDNLGGGYDRDFTAPFISLEERKLFTYNSLGIANFIVPALFEGIFSSFYNMKSIFPIPFRKTRKIVKLSGKSQLLNRDYTPFFDKDLQSGCYDYFEGSLSKTDELENVVLDIDLDYFSWDDMLSTTVPKRIEITKEAFDEFNANPYHPLRITPIRMLSAEEDNGRYYLRYAESGNPPKPQKEQYVRKRVDNFIEWLKNQPWKPDLITLCRSAYSGYLPSYHAELVERLLKEGLEGLYKLNYLND